MRSSRRNLVLVVTGALALSTFFSAPALADGGHGKLLDATLVGSNPAPASPVIAGIRPGSLPWVTGESRARVRFDGRIEVRVRGLVIPIAPFNGTNPVLSAVATLVCADAFVDSTDPFALDTAGNGRVEAEITVPEQCPDATVLIQPAGNRAVYIASAVSD